MGLFPGSDSGIERLTITAHQKVDCSDSSDKVFVCQVNPENLKYSFGIEANDGDSANGSSGTPSGFTGYVKMDLNFTFYADATGIVPIDDSMKDYFGSDDAPSIKGYLDNLQNVLYGYDEEIHSPPYLSFTWGNIFPSTANDSADSNFPPPSPSVPTKSVSQKLQIADSRSFSRPLHRLHPAKRKKTAGRPVCTPSPWMV